VRVGEGKGREREGEGEGTWEGREEEGKGFAGTMSNCFLRTISWGILYAEVFHDRRE